MAYTLSVLKGATAILTRVFLSVILLIIKKIRDARTFDKQTIRSVPFGLPTTTAIFNLETLICFEYLLGYLLISKGKVKVLC